MPVKRKTGVTKRKPAKRSQRGGMALLSAFHKSLGPFAGALMKHPMYGTGFFSDLGDGLKSAFNWVKDNKIISTVASLIPHPMAQKVGGIAGQLGFGARGLNPPVRRLVRL